MSQLIDTTSLPPYCTVVSSFCLVLVILVLAFRTYPKRASHVETPWPKVPGRRPILGNKLGSINNIVKTFEGWANEYGKDGIFEFKVMGRVFYGICNEKYASEIERKRPYIVTRRQNLCRALDSLGSEGLFSAEGDSWRKDRRIVAPSLNHKNVMEYVPKIKLVASRLVKKWNAKLEKDPNKAIAINSEFILATLDVISLVAFAQDLDAVTKGGKDGVVMDTLFTLAMYRTMSPIPYWKIPFIGQHLDGGGLVVKEAKRFCLEIVDDFKNNCKEQEEKAGTFLGKMIHLSEKSGEDAMSTDRFVGNLLTMYGAGTETTAATITITLYEIANNTSGLQDELIQENISMGNFETADLDTFTNSLPRLRSLLYEVLRMEGPVSFMGLESTEPIELAGIELPAGSNYLLFFKFITEVEEDKGDGKGTPLGPRNSPINTFCPRRYLIEKDGMLSVTKPSFKTGFRAFGGGVRHCPGRDLAETEVLVFISFILRTFEISLEPNHPKVNLISRLTQVPDCDIRLILKQRKFKNE